MNGTSSNATVMPKPRVKRSVGRAVPNLREVPSLSKDDKSFFTAISTSDRFSVASANKLFLGATEKA